eukprot:scaffold140789_cov307-Phaeocystis_antarctica.AAC.1
MKYPLLHTDVFIYKLDESFARGSVQYSNDSNSAKWDQTTCRRAGEDALSLAIRVQSAYLEMHENPALDEMTLYEVPLNTFHGNELSKRYYECLENDPDNEARGMKSAKTFLISWHKEMSEYDYG